jgi:hypothetical protein
MNLTLIEFYKGNRWQQAQSITVLECCSANKLLKYFKQTCHAKQIPLYSQAFNIANQCSHGQCRRALVAVL